MSEHKEKWMESMKARLDTDEEGVRQFMREARKKGKGNTGGKGGFAHIKEEDPERLTDISRKGANTRWKQQT